ncbi:MAG: aminomethyltransferase family protein [Candidatus Binatia bacterium]
MAKRSSLFAEHERRQALMIEQDGWLLPDHFGNPAAEYKAVQIGAGIFDLSHRAMLQFTGSDRLSFLQGMLSNDLRPLKMFEGQQATILTQQGKVIADARVLCAMNSIYLDFWEFLKEKIIAHLNRYLVADEVEIHDPNQEWKMLSLQGPRAPTILAELFANGELPAQADHHGMVQFDGAPVCVVYADRSGYDGFDIIAQAGQLLTMVQRLAALGATWVGARAQDILRIEAGMPRYGVDFNEDHLLLEVGLDDSYSYTKGCYLGQEVVERIRSRGHVNRKLCGLLLDGNTPANAADRIVKDDKEVGQVTSSVVSLALNRPIALGYIHKDFWAPGTKLSVRRENESIAATVTALPFVSPSTRST